MENDTPVDPVDPTPPETTLERIEAVIEDVAEELVDEVESIVHSIEHRSFGRASADEPMPVTTTTGN